MDSGTFSDHAHWYAVRTKPKEEDRADTNLRTWKVQTFTPKLRERRTSGYGGRYICKPLFSRYIFAHFNASKQLHDVNYTRGVQQVVSFGGSPIAVDDKIINFIKAQVDEDGFIRMDEELKAGDRVRITAGPLESVFGIFKRTINDTDRVRILLSTMNYQSHLSISKDMVEKAN